MLVTGDRGQKEIYHAFLRLNASHQRWCMAGTATRVQFLCEGTHSLISHPGLGFGTWRSLRLRDTPSFSDGPAGDVTRS